MSEMEVENQPSEMQQVLAMLATQSQEMKSLSMQMAALTTQSAGLSTETQDLAAKTQDLSEKTTVLSTQTQSMSVQVNDNATSIREMSARLTALEGGDAVGGDVGERPAKQARKGEGDGVSVGASPRRSAGAAGSNLQPAQRVPAASYQFAAKQASAAGVPQGNELWVKGCTRPLTRETLSEQTRKYVKMVNDEKGTNFSPKVFAWSLVVAAAPVLDDGESAQAFYKASESLEFTWTDMLEGVEYNRRLRTMEDVFFDQRCRSQVYYHLRLKLIELPEFKGMWHDGMQVGNTGPRVVVFVCGSDGRLSEVFRVDTSKRGEGELLSPTLAIAEKFLAIPKEIEEMAASVAKNANPLQKVHAAS